MGVSQVGGRTDGGACVEGSVVGGRNHSSFHTPSEQGEAEERRKRVTES